MKKFFQFIQMIFLFLITTATICFALPTITLERMVNIYGFDSHFKNINGVNVATSQFGFMYTDQVDKTFEQAKEICNSINGHLPTSSDLKDKKKLIELLKEVILESWIWIDSDTDSNIQYIYKPTVNSLIAFSIKQQGARVFCLSN